MWSCDWNDGDGVANGWPNMFNSSGNANGVHWLPTYDDAGGVNWASGYYFSTINRYWSSSQVNYYVFDSRWGVSNLYFGDGDWRDYEYANTFNVRAVRSF